jgi:hypothetical protein
MRDFRRTPPGLASHPKEQPTFSVHTTRQHATLAPLTGRRAGCGTGKKRWGRVVVLSDDELEKFMLIEGPSSCARSSSLVRWRSSSA